MIIPKYIRQFFWFSDPKKVDSVKNKSLIVSQLLNFGDKKATDWLIKTYDRKEIVKIASSIPKSAWDKKSLNFWSLVLGIKPRSNKRAVK